MQWSVRNGGLRFSHEANQPIYITLNLIQTLLDYFIFLLGPVKKLYGQ